MRFSKAIHVIHTIKDWTTCDFEKLQLLQEENNHRLHAQFNEIKRLEHEQNLLCSQKTELFRTIWNSDGLWNDPLKLAIFREIKKEIDDFDLILDQARLNLTQLNDMVQNYKQRSIHLKSQTDHLSHIINTL